jgi:hypothetical protein
VALHLVKLCVGAEGVQDLIDWHAQNRGRWPEGRTIHVTRMWPKRAEELLAGGSLYWVFKGLILARQQIAALEPERGADGIARCAIVLDDRVIRTAPAAGGPGAGGGRRASRFRAGAILSRPRRRPTCPRLGRAKPPCPRRLRRRSPISACAERPQFA